MDSRLWVLLGLGAVALLASQGGLNVTDAPDDVFAAGDTGAPSEDEAQSIAQGEGVDDAMSGLSGLGAVVQGTTVRAGSRIRYIAHAGQYSGGTPRNFATVLQRYGFIVRGYGEQRALEGGSSVNGGKYIWASVTLRSGFNNSFTMINILARLAQNAGYTLDWGAGGYRYE